MGLIRKASELRAEFERLERRIEALKKEEKKLKRKKFFSLRANIVYLYRFFLKFFILLLLFSLLLILAPLFLHYFNIISIESTKEYYETIFTIFNLMNRNI